MSTPSIEKKEKIIETLFANAQGQDQNVNEPVDETKDPPVEEQFKPQPRKYRLQPLFLVLIVLCAVVGLIVFMLPDEKRTSVATTATKPQKTSKQSEASQDHTLASWRKSLVSIGAGSKVEVRFEGQWRTVDVRDIVVDGQGRIYLYGSDQQGRSPRHFRMDKVEGIKRVEEGKG